MKRIIFCLSTILALVGTLASCHPQEPPPQAKEPCDIRRGENCYPIVSIYSLIANPKEYDGLPIMIVGYMGIDWNDVFLFPTSMSYDGRDAASSIQLLHDNFSDADHDALEKRAGNYVAAYGEFSTTYDRSPYRKRVGSLKLHDIPDYRGERVPEETSKGIVRLIFRDIPEPAEPSEISPTPQAE